MLLVLVVFHARFSGITVFLGATGAGVAFALREVILSFAGWLNIVFGGLYTAGDRVQLGGVKGDVIDVSILRTTLMEIGEWVDADLYTGRTVRIANSSVYQQPVYNYTGDFLYLWDEITLPIRHGSDRGLAREIMLRVTNEIVAEYTADAKHKWELLSRRFKIETAMLEPMVTMTATDNWLAFTIRYVVDYQKRRVTRDEIYTRIMDEFDKTEKRVIIASQTQEVVAFPELTVDVKHSGRAYPQ